MAITIGELVTLLETNCEPDDYVNFGSTVAQNLQVCETRTGAIYFGVTNSLQNADCLDMTSGSSKVSEVLKTLKTFLPDYKDKYVTSYVKGVGVSCLATNKVTPRKVFNFDFSKGINDLPSVKQKVSDKMWLKFQTKVDQFKEHENDPNFSSALISLGQCFIMKHPELETIFYIKNKFFHRFEDVLKVYPELKMDDLCLFEKKLGVHVYMKELNKIPKYVTAEGEFTLEQLLDKYSLVESQVGKIFQEKDGKFVCEITGLLTALLK